MDRRLPNNTYQWVASVARALPGAVFYAAKRRRDGLTRIAVVNGDKSGEYIVERTSALTVVANLGEILDRSREVTDE